MAEGPKSNNASPPSARVLVNLIYLFGAIASLIVGAYGTYIFVIGVIVFPGFSAIGLLYGLPLILASLAYLVFVLALLCVTRCRKARYSMRGWIPALLGLIGICLLGCYVFVDFLLNPL